MSTFPPPLTARGTILRDTNAGTGLLAVDGKQYPFTLEQHWRDHTSAPRVNAVVDVSFDADGQPASVMPVSEAVLNKERLDKVATELNGLKQRYLPQVLARADQAGKPLLAAVALLAVAWIWLPAVSINVMAGITQHMTMFDLLRLANAGASLEGMMQGANGSSGLYGVLCMLAIVAPLAHVFMADRRAVLGLFAPLAFLSGVALGGYLKVRALTAAAGESMRAFGGSQAGDFAGAMLKQAFAAFSLGYGSYIALAIALYLAWRGLGKVLAAR